MIRSEISVDIKGILGTIDIEMEFQNPLENPLEYTYYFPIEDKTVIQKLEAQVGERKIFVELQMASSPEESKKGAIKITNFYTEEIIMSMPA